jgi:Na+-transporting methylmalonyl-CoA/oxaloacetate decarboxylase gamma subunit
MSRSQQTAYVLGLTVLFSLLISPTYLHAACSSVIFSLLLAYIDLGMGKLVKHVAKERKREAAEKKREFEKRRLRQRKTGLATEVEKTASREEGGSTSLSR